MMSKSISGIKPKAISTSSNMLVNCVLDVFDLDVFLEWLLNVIPLLFQVFKITILFYILDSYPTSGEGVGIMSKSISGITSIAMWCSLYYA